MAGVEVNSFGVLLLAVDGSEHSRNAVGVARDLAALSHGKVHLLHVQELEQIPSRGGGSYELESDKEAESLVTEDVAILRDAGVDVEVDVQRGRVEDVDGAILDVAEEISADVIVMGSKRLSGLGALVLGSTTNKVLHASKRPVLVVP